MLEPPLPVDGLDAPLRVVGDLAPVVRPEARVVVRRVLGEVRRDGVRVARVERLVVGADVVEVADALTLSAWAFRSRRSQAVVSGMAGLNRMSIRSVEAAIAQLAE